MLGAIIICTMLTAVDGDTVKCDGVNMRLLGEGVPFVSGIDTPEIGSNAKCIKERKLALNAKARLKELLKAEGIKVVERVAHHMPANPHNADYLAVKKAKSGHLP